MSNKPMFYKMVKDLDPSEYTKHHDGSHPWDTRGYKYQKRMEKTQNGKTYRDHGFVYIINNPAWPEWVKIGCSKNIFSRLYNFQTSSPFRDYIMADYIEIQNRHQAEVKVHEEIEKIAEERRYEWFKISIEKCQHVLLNIRETEKEWNIYYQK